ncbi:MAG TPA: acyl-CoA dehydrogenase family protein [Thermoleophilaceae bacterium]
MDFSPSQRVEELEARIDAFLEEHYYPHELEIFNELDEEVGPGVPYPKRLVELRERAKAEGLWNLFLPDEEHGPGLTNWEYGMICEAMGRSPIAPMVFNCSAPDTGNAEILVDHGTPEQKQRWLEPLLEGTIRSCFSMTEPETAGSDPTGLRGQAVLDGDEWVIDAHKWFTSGAVGAEVAIAMVVTDPDAAPHKRASMILVPTDAPGFNLVRPVSVMGHDGGPGHCEIRYEECRVPKEFLLGERGAGFAIAQDRLGPGRIHHCMRAIGAAERALSLMCARADERETFGKPVSQNANIRDWIAEARMELDMARLYVMKTAWLMDTVGNQHARTEIAAIKVAAPNVALKIIDRAIQVHGGGGVSDDFPLARMYAGIRTLRLADGPDEVHKRTIARQELGRWREGVSGEGTAVNVAATAASG